RDSSVTGVQTCALPISDDPPGLRGGLAVVGEDGLLARQRGGAGGRDRRGGARPGPADDQPGARVPAVQAGARGSPAGPPLRPLRSEERRGGEGWELRLG